MSLKEYLNVPFGEKDVARKHGARFDGEAKKWYIPTYIEEQKKNQLRQLFGANKNSEPSLTNNNHNVDDKSNHNTEERSTRHAEESPFDSAGVLTHHHIEEYVIQHNEEDIAQNVDNNAVATASDDDISEQTARHNIEENITHISDDYCDATQRNNSTVLHQHDDNSNTQRNDVNNTQHNDENADAPIDDLSKWESALSNNTLNIIYMMKKSGLPEDKVMRGRIFRRLKRVDEGDYPITYDGLKVYFPELINQYPTDILKEEIRSVVSGGDYKKNIEQSDMSPDIKGLLLFILP